jgi:excisionase family DNA binding protein
MNDLLPDTEQWLSLTKAASLLGVHGTTLRRWADRGEIPFMLTPGGHRRFAINDIHLFANQQRRKQLPGTLSQVWAEKAMIQTRKTIVANQDQPWLAKHDEKSREQHRIIGRRIMGLTLQYISDVDSNETILEEARILGEEYGRLAIAAQLPLTDALQATIFFRDMLVETALQLPDSVHLKPKANLRLMKRINELLNTVHLAIAAAYETDS